MDIDKIIKVIDTLIVEANTEINFLQSQITRLVIGQVAIYAHDNIEGFPMTFGILSNSASLSKNLASELQEDSAQITATIMDREQRRNALLHLKNLIENNNEHVVNVLEQQLSEWVNGEFPFDAIITPDGIHPSGHIKSYPYK